MVDVVCQSFFAQPSHVQQRRYEALRAVFLDHRSQREVAETFGYQNVRAVVGTERKKVYCVTIRYLDEVVRLGDYAGTIRQIAVTGLGRARPTLFLRENPRTGRSRPVQTIIISAAGDHARRRWDCCGQFHQAK